MYQVQWHICEDNTDMKLQWNQIDWKKAEEQVNRLQIRIVKATLEQKLSNRGKKTPSIPGVFFPLLLTIHFTRRLWLLNEWLATEERKLQV